MEAYKLSGLLEKLKAKGLDVAEDGAKVIVEATLEWVQESAVASANKYDDLAVVLVSALKESILKEIDKIDGKEG